MACGGCLVLSDESYEEESEYDDDETATRTDATNRDRGAGNASLVIGGESGAALNELPPITFNNNNKNKTENFLTQNGGNSKNKDGSKESITNDSYTKQSTVNDNHSGMNNSGTHHSGGSGSDTILNTSYDEATPLFRNIEKEDWTGVLKFLNTGKWNNSMFTSTFDYLKSPSPEIQTRTWVTFYDKKTGQPEWSQLPLHAAISYNAPIVVIQKLIHIFPKAVQCTDREGMLPIHLAFGFGCPDPILALLLETFPASLDERGIGGRYPYECCDLGPNKIRGKIFSLVAKQAALRAQDEYDTEWKTFAKAAMKQLNLTSLNAPISTMMTPDQPQQDENLDEMIKNKSLSELLLELLEDRRELYDLKQKLTERLVKSPTKKAEKPLGIASFFPNGNNGNVNSKQRRSITPDSASSRRQLFPHSPKRKSPVAPSSGITVTTNTATTVGNASTMAVKHIKPQKSPLVAGGTSNKNRKKSTKS